MRFLPRGRRARQDAHLETALRATLTEHARHAPAADVLAERILAAVDAPPPARDLYAAPPPPRARVWRSWATPLVAAASVAAVAGAVVGFAHLTQGPARPVAAPPPPHSAHATHSTIGRTYSTLRTNAGTPAPTPTRPDRASRRRYMPPPPASTAPTLRDVRVLDLTFTGADDGWALASADCLYGSGRCTAVLRTRNGTRWVGIKGAAFTVPGVQGCAAPCVTNLRFADDTVGYAFGPSAMFMTTDGGRSWQQQPGGALALETLDGNVIRVVDDGTGCPGPCNVRIETASIGSTVWSPAPLPSSTPGPGWSAAAVQFARGVGGEAYLLLQGDSAGGASSAFSQLLRSTDEGRTWSAVGEPCPQTGGEVDSYRVSAGADGRVSVLCGTRQAPQQWFVATSTDAGAHFTAQPGEIPPAAAGGLFTGDPATVLISAGRRMARSTDGGRSWSVVARPSGPFGFLGFENTQVARAVTFRGNAIWTTRDGGVTWSRSDAFR